jgi:hypothetical protein
MFMAKSTEVFEECIASIVMVEEESMQEAGGKQSFC